ncbi:MAG: hypothetical protein RSD85_00795 [Erysipelotrichaceae bacterium]
MFKFITGKDEVDVEAEAERIRQEKERAEEEKRKQEEHDKEFNYKRYDAKKPSLEEQKLALFNRPYLDKYSSKKISLVVKDCTMLARSLVPMVKSAITLAHNPYLMADRVTYFQLPDKQFVKLKDSYLGAAKYSLTYVDEGELKAYLIQEDRLDVYKDLFGNFKWF